MVTRDPGRGVLVEALDRDRRARLARGEAAAEAADLADEHVRRGDERGRGPAAPTCRPCGRVGGCGATARPVRTRTRAGTQGCGGQGRSFVFLRCLRGELTGSRRESSATAGNPGRFAPATVVVALGPPLAAAERHGDSARGKLAENSAGSCSNYGLGSRSTARLMIWPPIVRPICVSSPAAWTAVVTSSTPLGRPRSARLRSRARRRGPGCARAASRARPRGRGAGAARRAAPAAAVGARRRRRSSAAAGGALRRPRSARTCAARRPCGASAVAALRRRPSRGASARLRAASPLAGFRARRGLRGGGLRLRRTSSARAARRVPIRSGRVEGSAASTPFSSFFGFAFGLLRLLDLVSHAPPSVRFPVRTRRTPAELQAPRSISPRRPAAVGRCRVPARLTTIMEVPRLAVMRLLRGLNRDDLRR